MITPYSFRRTAFLAIKDHPWCGRLYRKLGKGDMRLVESFLDGKATLGFTEFEEAVNRMFLGDENKPKRWTIICELLSSLNSAARAESLKTNKTFGPR